MAFNWIDISPFATPSPQVRESFSPGFIYAGAGKLLAFGGFVDHSSTPALSTAVFEYLIPGWPTIHYDAVNDPPWRYDFAMTWDGAGGVIMYGGQSTGFLGAARDDTWRYNVAGATWTDLAPAADPGERKSHGMTWDGSRVVLFGGDTDTTPPFGDTWVYSGGNWSLLTSTGPPDGTVFPQCLVSDRAGATYYFGNALDVWKLVGSTWTDITAGIGLTAPEKSLVLDPFYCVGLMTDGRIYGFDNSSDLWYFDPATDSFTFVDFTVSGFPGEISSDGQYILAHGGSYFTPFGDTDNPEIDTDDVSNHTWLLDAFSTPPPPPPAIPVGVHLPPRFLS